MVVSKKVKLESIPKLTKKAEKVMNAYIRRRDSEDGYFTCIVCSQTLPIEKMNAGHYVPVGSSSALRFDEYNINGECQYDNCFNKFHLVNYRKNLIEKIGLEKVEKLDQRSREVKKWSREELLEIIEKYK